MTRDWAKIARPKVQYGSELLEIISVSVQASAQDQKEQVAAAHKCVVNELGRLRCRVGAAKARLESKYN